MSRLGAPQDRADRAAVEADEREREGDQLVDTLGNRVEHRILAVPVMVQDKVTRWLVVRKPSDYDELDQESLEAIASYVAPKLTSKPQ